MTTTNQHVDLDQLDAALRDAREPFKPIPLTPARRPDLAYIEFPADPDAPSADAHVVTFPRDDEQPATDLPLEALVDVVAGAIDACGTLIDTLPNLRHAEPSHADTAAWDIHRRKAYLAAEERCSTAWRALMHAQQLIKGLAR